MMYAKENDNFRSFPVIMEDHDEVEYNMNEHAHLPMFEIGFNQNSLVESSIEDFDIFEEVSASDE